MLNRALIQPDPAVFIDTAADTMEAARRPRSLDDLFLRLEASGVMLRIDRDVLPTMAKTPTLAEWELDLLRTHRERSPARAHQRVETGRFVLDEGTVAIAAGRAGRALRGGRPAVSAAVPIWDREIRLQPVRAGFPCFSAALGGYVEATRDDDEERTGCARPSRTATRSATGPGCR